MNNFFRVHKSTYKGVHLISSKCLFYACPCTVMFSFSMASLKEIPTMFNASFLMKTAQPKEWLCRFELTCASVWPYPVFIECYSTIFQGIINFSKTMLYKICIMCTIVTDIKVIFFNDMLIFTRGFYMIDVLFSMSI